MSDLKQAVVFGGFDNIRSSDLRFLQEAAKLGALTVLVWPDSLIQQAGGAPPKFLLPERAYFLNAVRYLNRVVQPGAWDQTDSLPEIPRLQPEIWADVEAWVSPAREKFCRERKISYRVIKTDELKGFPESRPTVSTPGKRRSLSPAAMTGFIPATFGFWRKPAVTATSTSWWVMTRTSAR